MASADSLTAALIVVAAAVIYFHVKKFSFWSSRNVKGPIPWPIFGTNIYYILENKIELDKRWHKKYGKVYGLYEGYSPLLVVHDNELLNHIYVKQFQSFTDRHNEFIHDKVLRNWLLWVPGKEWSAKRALTSPMFSSSKMKIMAQQISGCVNRFLDEVESRRNSSSSSSSSSNNQLSDRGGVRMTKSDISAMTIDAIATSFYSLKLNTYRDTSNEFLKRAYDLALIGMSRFFAWSLIPRYLAKVAEFDLFGYEKVEYFDLLAKRIIEERRRPTSASTLTKRKFDFVQLFIEAKLPDYKEQIAQDSQQEEITLYSGQSISEQQESIKSMNKTPMKSMSDIEIRGQMNFLFVAGFETTAQTINFCLYELGHRPEVQEQLYNEMRDKFGANLSCLQDRSKEFPSEMYNDLMDLTHMGAFISETLRLYSPIINNTRTTTESVVLPGSLEIHLPRGTPITTNSYILQRDPDHWTEPDKFDMTRFYPENRQKIKPGTYIPFGLGARHCLGMRFALLEIRLALAKIILNHRILPVNMMYPPKFMQNPVFLLLQDNNFELVKRQDGL